MRVTQTAKGAFSFMTTLSVSPLAQSLGEVPPDNIIFGHSEVMQAVRSRLGKVAAANVPVLITGESGTGKDIIARLIHGLSPWKTGPYVKVNCPAIPGTLLESEAVAARAGGPVLPHRRPGRQEGRGASGVRDQPPPAIGNRSRDLPRGSLLPHQRGASAQIGAARTAWRH